MLEYSELKQAIDNGYIIGRVAVGTTFSLFARPFCVKPYCFLKCFIFSAKVAIKLSSYIITR